ncbi:MAG: inorganic phosphate transporter [Bacteroidales bacterium]|nr:inorganic phosphate transporter [Bacteroidales bacterium]
MTITLLYIVSGLYLGWLLGTNDTVNVFGSAVNLKMLTFRTAAFIASLFILSGAIFQGEGTTKTIHSLGNISEPAIAFSIALCVAFVVLILIKIKLPVSTSQAIVGGMLGWSIFVHATTDWNLLSKFIISWILAPVIGLILGMLFFILMRRILNRTRIHLIKLNSYLRIAMIIAIALAAFGLGANNIGNVVGIFSNLSPEVSIDFGIFSMGGIQILFLIGGISIVIGIYSYNWRLLSEKSNEILSLAPEATVVVLASQAVVLFLFSSSWLANLLISEGLPSFPLIPVSSTQIAIGSVIGIGFVKGALEIENKTLARIGLGWIVAPIGAGVLTYSLLFIIQKLFNYPIRNESLIPIFKQNEFQSIASHSSKFNMVLPGIIFLSAIIIVILLYLFFRQQKLRLKAEKDILVQQNQLYLSEKAMNELEMRTFAVENDSLNLKLQAKRKEFMDIALNISEQISFLEKISSGINEAIKTSDNEERIQRLNKLSMIIKQKMSFPQEKKEFYMQIEEIHKDFHMKLKTSFPDLTNLEKRLAGLLRLNLSTKEISTLLNISPKSVEVARYRLKKKMNIDKDKPLNNFINNL